jgi:hypothetical protein
MMDRCAGHGRGLATRGVLGDCPAVFISWQQGHMPPAPRRWQGVSSQAPNLLGQVAGLVLRASIEVALQPTGGAATGLHAQRVGGLSSRPPATGT